MKIHFLLHPALNTLGSIEEFKAGKGNSSERKASVSVFP